MCKNQLKLDHWLKYKKETIKLLEKEKYIEENLHNLGLEKYFLDLAAKVWAIKLDFIKTKTFSLWKTFHQNDEKKNYRWEENIINQISSKGLISRIN